MPNFAYEQEYEGSSLSPYADPVSSAACGNAVCRPDYIIVLPYIMHIAVAAPAPAHMQRQTCHTGGTFPGGSPGQPDLQAIILIYYSTAAAKSIHKILPKKVFSHDPALSPGKLRLTDGLALVFRIRPMV